MSHFPCAPAVPAAKPTAASTAVIRKAFIKHLLDWDAKASGTNPATFYSAVTTYVPPPRRRSEIYPALAARWLPPPDGRPRTPAWRGATRRDRERPSRERRARTPVRWRPIARALGARG